MARLLRSTTNCSVRMVNLNIGAGPHGIKSGGLVWAATPSMMYIAKCWLEVKRPVRGDLDRLDHLGRMNQIEQWIYNYDEPGMPHRSGYTKELMDDLFVESGFTVQECVETEWVECHGMGEVRIVASRP